MFEASITDIESNKVSLPPLRNPPKMENTDDLTNLSYLNEPSGTVFALGFCAECVYVIQHIWATPIFWWDTHTGNTKRINSFSNTMSPSLHSIEYHQDSLWRKEHLYLFWHRIDCGKSFCSCAIVRARDHPKVLWQQTRRSWAPSFRNCWGCLQMHDQR